MRRRCLFLPAVMGLWILLCPASSVRAQTPPQERDRLVVALVELAFLNDPTLCSYYPCARVEGNKVTLEGYLPDSSLKERAGQLASLVSRMPVDNDIKIHPGCRLIPAVIPNELLVKNAALALKARFPHEYRSWQLGLRSTGEIVVSGAIDSHEKKLQISQKLRGLPGCKCVVNMMEVHYGNVPVMAKNPAPGQAIQPVGGIQTPTPHAPLVPATPVLKPMPGEPASVTAPRPMPIGPKVQPGTMGQPSLPGHTTTMQKIEPANKVIWHSEQGSSPYQAVSSYPNPTGQQKPLAGSYPTPYSTVGKQQSLPVLATSHSSRMPTVPQMSPGLTNQVPSLAIPVTAEKGNAPGTVAIAVNRPATKPHTPYGNKLPEKLVELRKVIEMAGGGTITNLKMDLAGSNLSIRFFVANETQADRMADLITTLPQLDGYQLKLFIDVPE